MQIISRRTALTTPAGGAFGLVAGAVLAQRRMRKHTAITTEPKNLVSANREISGNNVSITIRGGERIITSNGIPNHAVGAFPNRGNPNRIKSQSYRFVMPVDPKKGPARKRLAAHFLALA